MLRRLCFGMALALGATVTATAQVGGGGVTYDRIISRIDKCQVEQLDQDLAVAGGQLLDSVGPTGLPLFVRASQSDCDEAIEHLILNGADVNAADAKGYSALHMAAEKSNEKVVKLLVTRGAKIGAVTKDGVTVLQAAEKNLYKGKTDERTKIIKFLKSKGAK